ncbi:hypothetical protein QOZ88_17305 [Blastococcus sp. BMG 814]|uniref:Uncharacterized protein n=1 Tax=Blastococcus carthaginiensis TaxID=3050034 RepID=A0ABT9IFP8_9ACTN|nr:hypothetical protein [Blastococcus carthaginiensis]MDP5184395.1 hypothetical protein [Blastococcus carthaginiensis]
MSVGDGLESTMAGAWVLPADDDRIDGLLVGRLMVTTPNATPRFGAGPDVAGLAAAVDAEIAVLDATFAAHLATLPSSRRSLVRPRWPYVPGAPMSEIAGDPLATEALTLARWVSTLLVAWDRVEKERLARPFLSVRGGDRPRDLPPGWPIPDSKQGAS